MRVIRVLLAVLVCGCVAPTSTTGNAEDPYGSLRTHVERIVDGDTIYVADLEERVRLIGIDTPEVYPEPDCYGAEASAHLEELIAPGSEVLVVFDQERFDQYDRNLGYLYSGDGEIFINQVMIADGYASVLSIPPNTVHADALQRAEDSARDAGLGLWTACSP